MSIHIKLQKYFNTWNTRNWESYYNLLDPNCTYKDWQLDELGDQEITEKQEAITTQHPDLTLKVKELIIADTIGKVYVEAELISDVNDSIIDTMFVFTYNEQLDFTSIRGYK